MALTYEYKQRVDFAAKQLGRELTPFVGAARSLTKQSSQLLGQQDRVIDQQGQLIDQQEQLIGLETEANEMLSGLLATSQRIESQLINIGNRLDDVSITLSAIHETLRTPTKTAAAELRDDALWALSRNLIEESEEMLERSLSVFQYDPVVHFYLGNIALLNDDPQRAVTAYRLARRYAAADMPPLTAGAALRGAIAADSLGNQDDALAILFETVDAIGRGHCPALHLAIASRNNDPAELARAFVGDATLLVDAAAREIPTIDEAADLAMASSWGPRLDRCSSTLRYAESVFASEGVPMHSPTVPPPAPGGAARLADTVVLLAWTQAQIRTRIRQTPTSGGFETPPLQGEEGIRQQWDAYYTRWEATRAQLQVNYEYERSYAQHAVSRARIWMIANLLVDGISDDALGHELHFEVMQLEQPGQHWVPGNTNGCISNWPPGSEVPIVRGRNVTEAIFLYLNGDTELRGQPRRDFFFPPDAWSKFMTSLYADGNLRDAFAKLLSSAMTTPNSKAVLLAELSGDYLTPW